MLRATTAWFRDQRLKLLSANNEGLAALYAASR
ncbi:hypothetical protein AFE_0319 [Acidithiobacillus ferrooxidans ATCC 23270]|uniref:Uncharacterized protein n=1 Tax=Acidithiobacillus ferrooxidans (strain ATCC 23270 / DSM 14882 / CIP 104768 / NCIMB 8455) TaxID=243159 RepID=B7J459_ACIF2|nr:hypothetical protein AFE_0319 [Acidithiobacillus ferrooxidans ATCC 23270]